MSTEHPISNRDMLLRAAVHWDRMAEEAPEVCGDPARQAAAELMRFDQQNASWLGGPGPSSATWSGGDGPLQYVRAQWKHYLDARP